MIAVIHYSGNPDPGIYYGLDEHAERRVLKGIEEAGYKVMRSTDDEWFGQSNPKYAVHHYNAVKRR